MLEKHKNVILDDNDSASKELEKINQKLIEDYELTNKEINEILNTHEEVIRFDMQLTSLLNPEMMEKVRIERLESFGLVY
ncbi:hypothetical protein RhiirA4_450033 [Rhizophagus irregularis]|uniref:Uncharacterized protein n=1 Tax=Rhizophagus irregularis TaxID=588596 RepID=A0A2I1HUX2_9GLOM|nr:hypothetical protein RhiirA4_450033 [Rhizophagus irregularis]